jgi:hypothetical protein
VRGPLGPGRGGHEAESDHQEAGLGSHDGGVSLDCLTASPLEFRRRRSCIGKCTRGS